MQYINVNSSNLINIATSNQEKYLSAKPFNHIVIDNFFKDNVLEQILNDFPKNLDYLGENYNNKAEKKLTLNKLQNFSSHTKNFFNYLNSLEFIEYLQNITGIKEALISDPYLIGGGLHELRNGGYLNVHADFNRHPKLKLDRRLNVLIYLNKDWISEYGGELQLWDKEMKNCEKKIIPIFNRMVIFSTTDFSYHGNPTKISCPNGLSRKSLALYYYSNGRPLSENILGDHSTIFRKRPNSDDVDGNVFYKKLFGRIYIKKKKKII